MSTVPEAFGKRPSPAMELTLLNSLFHVGTSYRSRFDRYLKYYIRESAMLNFGTGAAASRNNVALGTHDDLVELVGLVRYIHHTKSDLLQFSDLCGRLKTQFAGDGKAVDRTLDLALRLWLMLNVRGPETQLQTPQTRPLQWSSDQSLQDFLTETFPTSSTKIEVKESRLHPSFTAAFMVDICSLNIEWTDCLADHLRLDRRAHALRVYSYKSVLQAHLNLWSSSTRPVGVQESPFPERLIRETIWTLNLLFPEYDTDTISLLKTHQQNFQDVGPYEGPPTSNLNEFDYWRDRLREVHDVVFLAPPVSWAQLWRDRRNPQQFWTFWLAFIIFILTLVSTVAGLIQTWASVKGLSQ